MRTNLYNGENYANGLSHSKFSIKQSESNCIFSKKKKNFLAGLLGAAAPLLWRGCCSAAPAHVLPRRSVCRWPAARGSRGRAPTLRYQPAGLFAGCRRAARASWPCADTPLPAVGGLSPRRAARPLQCAAAAASEAAAAAAAVVAIAD